MLNLAKHPKTLLLTLGAVLNSALLLVMLPLALFGTALQAQTFTVLHQFTGGADGANPRAGLTMDAAGNLYGTTYYGGNGNGVSGAGTVFELTRRHSGWTFNPLYKFGGGSDGANPYAGVVFGPDGTLYGTTYDGGGNNNGTVFNLRPPPTVCTSALCPWTEVVIHRFAGGADGGGPMGSLTFGPLGEFYGSTQGTPNGSSIAYEFEPLLHGGWTESILYYFDGMDVPWGGLTLDGSGNLYGLTPLGGDGECFRGGSCGTVFELSRSGWIKRILYNFQSQSDGGYPHSGLIFDNSGKLYGASGLGGTAGGGSVFMLSGQVWTFHVIYGLGLPEGCYPNYGGPAAPLTMDANGNLFGTASVDGAYCAGSVFKLTPSSDGSWTYTDLHDFTGGTDGGGSASTVVIDASGNMYGTTYDGGTYGYGTVWEIRP